jgi:hypothetical protein
MRDWVKHRIKKLFENTESTITNIILLALFGGSATFLAFSKKALYVFLQIATTPTPLWATILLVILVFLYIRKRFRIRYSSFASIPASSESATTPKYKIEYFTVGYYKWETKIYRKDYFEVDKYPICSKHDLPLIYDNFTYQCPEVDKQNCDNKFPYETHEKLYATAKSYIEKEIRNSNY